MRAKSCFSTNIDPYRAGLEIGSSLAEIEPEVIFLFPTIHYEGSAELLEALYEELPSPDTILIGASGDGFYERELVAGAGVSALGISSGGAISWRLQAETGVGAEPYAATRRALERLNGSFAGGGPQLYFLVSDFRTNTTEVNEALRDHARAPVVGGSAADDYEMERCFVYANQQVLSDGLVILGMSGDFAHEIRVAHELRPTGAPGVVSETEGTLVRTVGDVPAMDFIERELGKPVGTVDEGILTFRLTTEEEAEDHRIRSLMVADEGSVKLFGGVEAGDRVQVCLAPREQILADVVEVCRSLDELPFTPQAALVVSCAGRKRVLGESLHEEVGGICQGVPSLEALAGFPSFGEFGPLRSAGGYSPPYFHNMTLVLLLLGDAAT